MGTCGKQELKNKGTPYLAGRQWENRTLKKWPFAGLMSSMFKLLLKENRVLIPITVMVWYGALTETGCTDIPITHRADP